MWCGEVGWKTHVVSMCEVSELGAEPLCSPGALHPPPTDEERRCSTVKCTPACWR